MEKGKRYRLLKPARTVGGTSKTFPIGTEFTCIEPSRDYLDWFCSLIEVEGSRWAVGWLLGSEGRFEEVTKDETRRWFLVKVERHFEEEVLVFAEDEHAARTELWHQTSGDYPRNRHNLQDRILSTEDLSKATPVIDYADMPQPQRIQQPL